MKKLVLGLFILLNLPAFADENFAIDCSEGYASYKSRTQNLSLGQFIEIPSGSSKLVTDKNYNVTLTNVGDAVVISLVKKKTKNEGLVEGTITYKLKESIYVNFHLKG